MKRLLLAVLVLVACGKDAEQGAPKVTPETATVPVNGGQQFIATPASVTWSVDCGAVSTSGLYSAPGAPGTCHVTVASVIDTTKTAVATVTVVSPVHIAVSPAAPTMDACTSLTFTATVTGSSNTAAVWTVQEGAAGGTVTSSGVYTAPSASGTYHVVATAAADVTQSATATVVVRDHILSVAVSPLTPTVPAGGTQQFTATVTTTCGPFAATP